MRRSYLLNALLIFFAATLQAQESGLRPMTTDDGLNMVRVGDALISPDGQWVFFSESRVDWGENERKTTYHMIPASGGESFQYIGEAGGSSFQFSPNGQYLSFRRAVEKKQQIFLMRTNGGEAVQLTKHENSISSYKWGHDSRTMFFLAAEPRSKDEEKKHEDGYDAVFVDEGPNGQQEGSWNNLWRFSIESKKEQRVTNEEFRIGSWDVSPDGKRILFAARHENRRNQGNLSEIYLYNIEDSTKIRLTENQAPESGMQWAPGGSRFMYTAVSADTWELRQSKIWIMDTDTRESRMVSGAFEGSISNPVWAPDGKAILFTGRDRTNANLFELDVNSDSLEQLTHMVGTLSASSYSQDRNTLVYSFSDFSTPSDLYVTSTRAFEPVRLTHANPWIETDLKLAQSEVIRWSSKDGLEIEGILTLPSDYVEGSRLPLLLHVHGGPAGVFTNTFRSSSHVWAGFGFAQLFPNVRGSSAYSDEFLQGNMRDIGGGDFWDLMTGVDHLISEGYVDADKMGIRGWSYGGILGGWTITQTNRFKAASLGAMVSDWTSEYAPGFNYDVRRWYIGGTPWENPEAYRQMSALTHVANVTTPTLLLHGINDRTDTEPQSMMFFTALKDLGITTRYIKFPREPHGFREPRHQRTRDIEELKWIQRYVLGIEWTPWEREEDKAKEDGEKPKTVSTTPDGGTP